jgi:hypothetical protein
VAAAALVVEVRRGRDGVGTGLDDRTEERVQLPDAVQVSDRQLAARQPPARHQRLQLGDRRLDPRLPLRPASPRERIEPARDRNSGSHPAPEERPPADAALSSVHGPSPLEHRTGEA